MILAAGLLALAAPAAPSAPAAGQTVSSAPLADTQLADPVAEAKAQALMEELRCLTCQSQSIAGEEPEQVRAWLVERYGDYVTFRPGFDWATWPLYALPLLFILVAGVLLFRRIGRGGE